MLLDVSGRSGNKTFWDQIAPHLTIYITMKFNRHYAVIECTFLETVRSSNNILIPVHNYSLFLLLIMELPPKSNIIVLIFSY